MKALSNDLLTVWTYDELVPDDRNEENRLAHADERDRYAERGGVFGSEAGEWDGDPDTIPAHWEFADLGESEPRDTSERDRWRDYVRHRMPFGFSSQEG